MNRKMIDASREVRLWIATISGVIFAVAAVPEWRDKIAAKYYWRKSKIEELLQRKRES